MPYLGDPNKCFLCGKPAPGYAIVKLRTVCWACSESLGPIAQQTAVDAKEREIGNPMHWVF